MNILRFDPELVSRACFAVTVKLLTPEDTEN